MTDYITRQTAWHISKRGDLLDDLGTEVEIQDEGAGEYVVLRQVPRSVAEVRVDLAEWPTVRAAIDAAVASCRTEDPTP